MSQEPIEQTFNVSGRARLVVSNVRGSVMVRPGEAGVIHVQARKHTDTGSHSDVRITQDADGTVHAEVTDSQGMLSFMNFSKPCKVDFTIQVPAETDLKASVVSSSLDVAGLNGEMDLHSVSGNCELADLNGPLRINTVSGDVSASRLAGALSLETVSGDVRLDESSLGSAKVRTVSGDVLLQTPLGEGPYQFTSVSGDVRLVILPGVSCTLEISTVSGRIVSPQAQASSYPRHRSQTVELNGGGVRISLKSVSGNLVIGSSMDEAVSVPPMPPAPPVPPAPPMPPAPPAPPVPPVPPAVTLTTAEILEKIERGEMSVEEGIKLIDAQR